MVVGYNIKYKEEHPNMQLKLKTSTTPKSRDNLYLYNNKFYIYTGIEGHRISILTSEFEELNDQSLSSILNILAHSTKDEEEYKVLCHMSDMAYSLEDKIEKLKDEVEYYYLG